MAKKEKPSSEELLRELIKIHVPEEYLAYFDSVEVKDKPDCYELVLHEKEDLVPEALIGKEVVLDGWFLQSDKHPYPELFSQTDISDSKAKAMERSGQGYPLQQSIRFTPERSQTNATICGFFKSS
jgi:hypothetical protein